MNPIPIRRNMPTLCSFCDDLALVSLEFVNDSGVALVSTKTCTLHTMPQLRKFMESGFFNANIRKVKQPQRT